MRGSHQSPAGVHPVLIGDLRLLADPAQEVILELERPCLGGFLLPARAASEPEHRDDVTRTLVPHVTCSHVFAAAPPPPGASRPRARPATEPEPRDDVTRTLVPHVTCSHVFAAAFHAHASRLPSVVRMTEPSARCGSAAMAASRPEVITYSTGTSRAASSSAVRRAIWASRPAISFRATASRFRVPLWRPTSAFRSLVSNSLTRLVSITSRIRPVRGVGAKT